MVCVLCDMWCKYVWVCTSRVVVCVYECLYDMWCVAVCNVCMVSLSVVCGVSGMWCVCGACM